MCFLLPEFCHGMTPDQKKEVQDIFPGHDESYNPFFMHQLHEDCNIPYINMSNVCLFALLFPRSILKCCIGNCPRRISSLHLPLQILKMLENLFPLLNSNLDLFQIVPRGSNMKANLTGADIFIRCVRISAECWGGRAHGSMKGPTILNFLLEIDRWNVFIQNSTSSRGGVLSGMMWVMVHH